MTFKEYKATQIQAGGEIPPCVDCAEFVYNRCRDKGIECIKFIEYCDPDKRQSKRARDYIRFKEKKANGHSNIDGQKSTNV